jgi:hypothetical protein
MILYLSLVLMAGTIWAAETPAKLKPGDPFPNLSGEYLSGRKAELPLHARGKVAFLALGFTYDSRFAVERWTKEFRQATRGRNDVTFYEIPMIGGMARMGRWFIDSGMRRGTPDELHENVITVYGGTDPWKKRLGYRAGDHAYLVLLDPEGRVEWVWHGLWDEAAFSNLKTLLHSAKR